MAEWGLFVVIQQDSSKEKVFVDYFLEKRYNIYIMFEEAHEK